MSVCSAPYALAVVALFAIPLGFLLGWLSGFRENEVRSREDRKAGRCSACQRPFASSSSCNATATETSVPIHDDSAGSGMGSGEVRRKRE